MGKIRGQETNTEFPALPGQGNNHQARQLRQFLVSLVTMFAGSFKFLTSSRHSLGFWASSSAQLHQCWPRDGSAKSPGPTVPPAQCQGCAAAVLQPLQATQGEKITRARGWRDAQPSRSSRSTMPCPDLPSLRCFLQPT